MVNVRGIDSLELVYATSLEEAQVYAQSGYEPVECSFGSVSVTGKWKLDHHGELADEEPVSLKAARIAMASDFQPQVRWLVAGMPDSDAIYAILVLSGLVAPDLQIAQALAELDLDPVGIDRTEGCYLREVLFQMSGPKLNSLDGYLNACEIGLKAFMPGDVPQDLLQQGLESERQRVLAAHKEIYCKGNKVLLVRSDEASRDVWHTLAPVVIQYKPTNQVITFSGRGPKGAARLGVDSIYDVLGKQGFVPLYSMYGLLLDGTCGGRPDIGGSPRGRKYSLTDAERVFSVTQAIIRNL